VQTDTVKQGGKKRKGVKRKVGEGEKRPVGPSAPTRGGAGGRNPTARKEIRLRKSITGGGNGEKVKSSLVRITEIEKEAGENGQNLCRA